MNVRLIAKSQAAVDQLITPASASQNSRLTPPLTVPRSRIAPLADQRIDVEELGRPPRGEVAMELGDDHGDLRGVEVEPDRRPDEAAEDACTR